MHLIYILEVPRDHDISEDEDEQDPDNRFNRKLLGLPRG